MLIRSNSALWKEYVQHDFVKQLGQGTLSRERFVHFLKYATTVTSQFLPLLNSTRPATLL
jgi:thiaminase